MSQRGTHIVYKINTEANGNMMPFKLFKNLIPMSTIEQLQATKETMLWF